VRAYEGPSRAVGGISRDGSECETHETYPNSEGLLEHNAHVGEARAKLFAESAGDHFMTVYGEVSQELGDLMEGMQKAGHLRVTWFSFVQGLEVEEVLGPVGAAK
jgi:hypothetical protein